MYKYEYTCIKCNNYIHNKSINIFTKIADINKNKKILCKCNKEFDISKTIERIENFKSIFNCYDCDNHDSIQFVYKMNKINQNNYTEYKFNKYR